MGLIKHLDSIHFSEVPRYKTYSYPEFRKNDISFFETTDLPLQNIKELMAAQQKPDVAILKGMNRVQDPEKTFPKFEDANQQDFAVSTFCQGVFDQDFARMTAIQANGDVSSSIRIATSAMAFGKNQQYAQH